MTDDEDTWDEERYRSVQEPLEIRFSIQPSRPGSGPERRQNAQRLLAELLEMPEETRRRRLRERQFHDPCLLELLLEMGHAALPFDVRRAVELTTLAADLGSLLQQHGALEENEGLARALCLMGTARRLVGDLAIADAAFEQAGRLVVSLTERGLFCRALALLRWDQGRTEEVVALLHQGGQRFAEALDFQELAVCRALLGLFHIEEGQLSRAALFLAQASQDLPGFHRPWLAAQTWLGLALCHATSENLEKARSARQRARAFYREVKDENALLSMHWLEGRGAYLLGETALLEGVRRKLIARHLLPEAALITLDLCVLRLATGRGHEVGSLVEEIATSFAGNPGLDLALGALAQTVEGGAGPLSPEIWSGMAPILRLAFRLQGARLQPVPFA
jgi:tetratricopeptide (TPR) repeat protein